MDALAGNSPSPGHEFFYFNDDGPLVDATFYEPGGSLHRVSKNASKGKSRVLAVVLHPRDAKETTIFEPTKK